MLKIEDINLHEKKVENKKTLLHINNLDEKLVETKPIFKNKFKKGKFFRSELSNKGLNEYSFAMVRVYRLISMPICISKIRRPGVVYLERVFRNRIRPFGSIH